MAALVADYSSSESDGEAERENGTEPDSNRPRAGKEARGGLEEPLQGVSRSDEEVPGNGGTQMGSTAEPRDASALLWLPPPEFEGGGGLAAGVFTNPFAQERRERLSLLEKHVRLTACVRPEQAGGRKVCLAHRRDGRCRYGSNCKFAHDSDLPTSDPEPPQPPAGSQAKEENVGGEQEPPKRGKKRPGLGPTLIPPKRSLKNYQAQRAKEGLGLL
uniref:uncharacterized protein n=1 Tax=Pristiophorus japonicus TaxID=55135 RepID=UPI00398F7660